MNSGEPSWSTTTGDAPVPLTAFSRSSGEEMDVAQLLQRLARTDGQEWTSDWESVPEKWRMLAREDMECPSCFVLGAELVSEARERGSRRVIRQACFRFPMHRPLCDFAPGADSEPTSPENLVNFGAAKTALTRAVRLLVGAGIEMGAFSQRSIRDMREWFFTKKQANTFTVTLDPEAPHWWSELWRLTGSAHGTRPIALTPELAALDGFNWREEAQHRLHERYQSQIEAMRAGRLWLHKTAPRIAELARRHRAQIVFDPTPLREPYLQTVALATFITTHYLPIRRSVRGTVYEPASVILAFAALLLFVAGGDLDRSAALFGQIARGVSDADETRGNVIGLNPWHDFEAWNQLKMLQAGGFELVGATLPKDELAQIEVDLRSEFSALQR